MERASIASFAMPHTGDCLSKASLIALGLHLRQAEVILAAEYSTYLRLGLPVYDRAGLYPACFRPQ